MAMEHWVARRARLGEQVVSNSPDYRTRVYRPVGENGRDRRCSNLTVSKNSVEPAHTQPNYFAPTYSEVVNLTGLLITKD